MFYTFTFILKIKSNFCVSFQAEEQNSTRTLPMNRSSILVSQKTLYIYCIIVTEKRVRYTLRIKNK